MKNRVIKMKQNGFTLAELLGVITILGLLALIVIPLVDKNIKEGTNNLYESQIKSIETAAEMWGIDHKTELPEENEELMIPLNKLQQEGYIKNDIENPKTNEVFDPDLQIKIVNHGSYYTYQVIES